MSTESLELAIKYTQTQLDGREFRKNIAWAIIAMILFFGPVFLFFNMSSDSAYQSSYAPIVIVWFMVVMVAANIIAGALFAGRTTELRLSLEMAIAILKLSKERENAS